MIEITLHDCGEFDFEGLNTADCGDTFFTTETVNVKFAIVDVSDIIVFEEKNSFRVFDDCRGIRGKEEFDGERNAVFREESSGLRAMKTSIHGRFDGKRKEF
jgi:hypothetical protein